MRASKIDHSNVGSGEGELVGAAVGDADGVKEGALDGMTVSDGATVGEDIVDIGAVKEEEFVEFLGEVAEPRPQHGTT